MKLLHVGMFTFVQSVGISKFQYNHLHFYMNLINLGEVFRKGDESKFLRLPFCLLLVLLFSSSPSPSGSLSLREMSPMSMGCDLISTVTLSFDARITFS